MKVKYKKPVEIMNDMLFKHFKNNVYFKFSDFAQKVKEVQSKETIEHDMMKDFIYEMIDEKIIEQVYVDENENPFLDESSSSSASIEKSVHFKLIVAENEN